ncbi:MAG: hypothetical protein GC137_02730 [Alphaproteobacteria bacterium]|nr:hypothetical protein [Alphaproteobacteria bacterium]
MARPHNRSGKAYQAKPAITTALAFDPEKDDFENPIMWASLEAKDFDPKQHDHLKFFCPGCMENGKAVQLKKPTKKFVQNIPFDVLDRGTGKHIRDHLGNPVTDSRRYEIPARFTLYPGEKHGCDAAVKQAKFAAEARKRGAVTLHSGDGVRLLNLNIPAGQKLDEPRPASKGRQDFGRASGTTVRIHTTGDRQPQQHSEAVKSVRDLAVLLDETVDTPDLRETTYLRNGTQTIPLSALYDDNALDLYRALFILERRNGNSPDANHNNIAAFLFDPSADQKRYWKRYGNDKVGHSVIVTSRKERVEDRDGNTFEVAIRVKFPNISVYNSFRAAYASAPENERRFLIYSEEATVNLAEWEAQKANAAKGAKSKALVHVNVTIREPAQLMKWIPKEPAAAHHEAEPEEPSQNGQEPPQPE